MTQNMVQIHVLSHLKKTSLNKTKAPQTFT
jgi:hypothetical protein